MVNWGPEDRAKLRRLTTEMRPTEIQAEIGCGRRSVFRWMSGESDPLPPYRRGLRELFKASDED